MINKYRILNGAKYFSVGVFQNYLVFISANKYWKFFSGTTQIYSWKSKGTWEESIGKMTNSDITPTLVNTYSLSYAKFSGKYLINSKTFVFKKVINLHFSYALDPW